ncbi:MAG: hypothetical protein LBU41_02540 [Clostridiales Family XIII bacterium]|jgi:hypothetical protein|nr:hypothetical protein [Clostridiales Family XIII bacterium]
MKRNAEFEPACATDASALLNLIESRPAKGDIELLYTRRPDPIASYARESDDVSVGVLRDKEGKIWFMEATVYRDCFMAENVCRTGYLCGIKQHPNRSARIDWLRALYDYESRNADGFYCSILTGNTTALQLFTKERAYMPPLQHICDYTTLLLNPKALLQKRKKDVGTKMPTACDCSCGVSYNEQKTEINAFLNSYGKSFNFFPHVKDIPLQFSGIKDSDMFVLRENNEIVAFAALWDQSEYRQNILTGYNGSMRILRHFSALSKKLGYIPFPKVGARVHFACLALVCVKDRNLELLGILLDAIAKSSIRRGYEVLVYGIPSDSWQTPVWNKIRKVSFGSKLYFTEPRTATQPMQFKCKPPHFEVGWL